MVKVTMGYPEPEDEIEILYSQNTSHPFDDLKPVVTCHDVLELQADVKTVNLDRTVAEYILRLVSATRKDSRLQLSVSPRGSLALYRTSQARAALAVRDYVLPEDVRSLAVPVLAHRIGLDTRARYSGVTAERVIEEILEETPVPR